MLALTIAPTRIPASRTVQTEYAAPPLVRNAHLVHLNPNSCVLVTDIFLTRTIARSSTSVLAQKAHLSLALKTSSTAMRRCLVSAERSALIALSSNAHTRPNFSMSFIPRILTFMASACVTVQPQYLNALKERSSISRRPNVRLSARRKACFQFKARIGNTANVFTSVPTNINLSIGSVLLAVSSILIKDAV